MLLAVFIVTFNLCTPDECVGIGFELCPEHGLHVGIVKQTER